MANVQELQHPLIQHKLTQMRKKETPSHNFQQLCTEISRLMAYEVTKDLETEDVEIETPLMKTMQPEIKEKNLVIVPILRAGIGMVDGFTDIIPTAKIGHIGLYRDPESKEAVEYFLKLPSDVEEREVIIVDPMLATGGSAISAIDSIKKRTDKPIKLVNILAAPEGVAAVQSAHPDVDIYVAKIDEGLNENKYIVPGLGDAGDRLFGTL